MYADGTGDRLASQAIIMVSRQGTADVIPDLKDIQDRLAFPEADFRQNSASRPRAELDAPPMGRWRVSATLAVAAL